MNPNDRPEIILPSGRPASAIFDADTLDGMWPHLLVPRPTDSTASLQASMLELASAGVIPVPDEGPEVFGELAEALWQARLAQQSQWPAEGWPLDRIARRLREQGIAAEWALPVNSEADAVDALATHRASGLRGAVVIYESQAVELALQPGDASVVAEAFVTPKRKGFFGKPQFDVREYQAGCEFISTQLVNAARAEGIEASWDGNWERTVVLHDVQFMARLPQS